MPPNHKCPQCGQLIEDWQFECCPDGALPQLYQGKAISDCPLCKQPVSYQGGNFSIPTVTGLPVLKRQVLKAARWSANNQHTLEHYLLNVSAGKQHAAQFTPTEIQQSDAQVRGTP